MFDFPAKFKELLFNMLKALVVWGLVGKRAFPLTLDALLLPELPVDLSGKLAFPVGDLLLERTSSSLVDVAIAFAGWLEFRHLFTCSFTKAAENERPQIGQSTQFVVCDIPLQLNEISQSFQSVAATFLLQTSKTLEQ